LGTETKENEPIGLVMEHIQGENLDLIIKKENGLSESLIQVYAYQLLNAIVYMHSRNIMHRYLRSKI
jgi:serine/threonine protein kinase